MNAFGQDVAAVVADLRLERVILVGHSMGGSVVLEAAQTIGPDRVAGIVLVDAFHDPLATETFGRRYVFAGRHARWLRYGTI